jgi:hypothetical protein
MIIVKSALVGLAAAVLASVLFAVIALTIARQRLSGMGSASGVLISGPVALLVALIAFVSGYAWEFRRLHR